MGTNKPIISVVISEDDLKEVQTYQHENFIKSQSKAIISLIKKGLDEYDPEEMISNEEKEILRKYRILDSFGVEALLNCLDIQYRRCIAEDRKKEKGIS